MKSFYLGRRFSRGSLIALALTVLLPPLYFYPAVIGQVALVEGDGWAQSVGVRVLVGQMLRQGFLPLWNPLIFAGMPLLASAYPGALYPHNWLFAFLPAGVAINLVTVTTYHLALAGGYLYGRIVGMGRMAAMITAIAFTFGGFMVLHQGQTHRLAAAAWLPWILLAIEHLFRSFSWRWITLGALFVGFQLLAGEPQMAVYTALLAGCYAVVRLTHTDGRKRWAFVAGLATVTVCGLLLAAVQLLPSEELVRHSERARLSYEAFSSYALPPRQIGALIFPFLFGGGTVAPYSVRYHGEWGGTFITCGYVGFLTWILALVGLFESRKPGVADIEHGLRRYQRQLVWLWAVAAVFSILLALGSHLPFGMNYLLYRIPIYNLFRAAYRHQFEFSFALAVLAGFGLDVLSSLKALQAQRALRVACSVMLLIVALAGLSPTFLSKLDGNQTGSDIRPGMAEVLIPVFFLALTMLALWLYLRRPGPFPQVILLAVLFGDLAAFGHALGWRQIPFSVFDRLKDPASVNYIKKREGDLTSFRFVSHADWPYADSYDLLNYPNVSVVRGLQSINGYDVLRLSRLVAVSGGMTNEGVVRDFSAFDYNHRGFDLLNVKYLLYDPIDTFAGQAPVLDGIRFRGTPLNLTLGPGAHSENETNGAAATELVVVSILANSAHIPDQAPMVLIKLRTRDGRTIEQQVLAGRDTSEWAYDRPDVRAAIKHRRARIASSATGEGFESHQYLARFNFARSEIERIEWDYIKEDAEIVIQNASLFDSATQTSTPLRAGLPANRWRKLERFGRVELYQNLRSQPRAWFAQRLRVIPSAQVLQAIRGVKLPGEVDFDMTRTALLEREDMAGRLTPIVSTEGQGRGQVQVTTYAPQRIQLKTSNPDPGFLVISEMYYPGWEAKIDGHSQPIYRTDYILRGIAVPAGDHIIEMVYAPASFRAGVICFVAGLSILVAGFVLGKSRLFSRRKVSE